MRKSLFTVGVAFTMILGAVGANAETLKLETYAGPRHAMNTEAWPTWITQVEEASGGDLEVRMSYPPINPRDLYDRVRDGIADVAWITHGYTTGRFVLTDMVELPGNGGNAETRSRAYWRIYSEHLMSFNEHKGVRVLALFTHGPGMLHTREAVNSMSDLNGLKIRTGGGTQQKIAERLGVVSVSAPATQAHELLSQGVADGIFFSIETITSFSLDDVLKYHYEYPGGLYTASFAVIMNQSKYESLTDDQKASLEQVTGEHLSALIGRTWDNADQVSVNHLQEIGNTITPLAEAMVPEIRQALSDLDQEWVNRAKEEGVENPAAILEAYRAEIRKIEGEN